LRKSQQRQESRYHDLVGFVNASLLKKLQQRLDLLYAIYAEMLSRYLIVEYATPKSEARDISGKFS
jgi:hypothetical protein